MDKPLNAHNQNSINHLDFGQPPPEGFFARFKEFYDAATALDQLPLLDVPDWLSTYTATSIYSAISLNIQQAKPLIEAAPKFLENFLPPTYALREPTMTDQELQKLLHDLPSLKAPEGLAARVMERIQEDLLAQNLQGLKVKAPEGFAARIAERIQEDALKTELQSLKVTAPEGFASKVLQHIHSQSEAEMKAALIQLPEMKAPEGFAAQIAERIQEDALKTELQSLKVTAPEGFASKVLQHIHSQSEAEMKAALIQLPEMKAPEGFAAQIAERIQEDALKTELQSFKITAPEGFASKVLQHMQTQSEADLTAALQNLPAIQAPEGFAAHVASRIARDAHPEDTHNPAPLYLVGMALLAAAFALFSFVFPDMQVGVSVLMDLIGNISGPVITVLGALALISLFGLFSKIKFTPQITYAAFAVAMLTVFPNVQNAFGPATVPPQQEVANVVRVGGDVVVRGHVTGDVVALGGDIKLVQGAQVDGRTVSILGDVMADPGIQASIQPAAILGRINGELPVQQTVLPSVGVASAFVPLMDLMKSEYWPAFYFAFLCIFTLLVYQSGHGTALVRQSLRDPNRNLALGYVAFLVALPVILVSTLIGNAMLLGLGIALLVALTAGLSISLLLLGAALTRRLKVQSHPVTFSIIGLTLYLVLLPFPAVATVVWFAGGCYGLGVLLNYIRKTNVTHLKVA